MKHLMKSESCNPMIRKFNCKNLQKAAKFVKTIMSLSDQYDHHPKITVEKYNVTIELFTHSENAVTDKDLDMMDLFSKKFVEC